MLAMRRSLPDSATDIENAVGNLGSIMTETVEALPAAYVAAAVYAFDSDCVEYIKSDVFCIHERVDSRLTLVKDATGHNLIGFKIKGFRNIFERMRVAVELSDGMFLPLVEALLQIYTEIGDELFDGRRKAAYRAAYVLAANDNVRLDGVEQLRMAA